MSDEKGCEQGAPLIDSDEFLRTLLRMPRKILDNHEKDGLAQMVLHELGQQKNLDLKRAFFLISSPDFNCLRGVAGFCKQESSHCLQKMWEDPACFCDHIQKTSFHADMKQLLLNDEYHQDGALHKEESINDIGTVLGMEKPSIHTWSLRHGNKGILIYEEGDKQLCSQDQDLLDHVTALLGLCPLS